MEREEMLNSIENGDIIAVAAEVVMARTALKQKVYKIRIGGFEVWVDGKYVVGKGLKSE